MSDKTYKGMGFLYGKYQSVHPEDYFDFLNKTWPLIELQNDLRFGVLPSGMLIRTPDGQIRVVLNAKLFPVDENFTIVR